MFARVDDCTEMNLFTECIVFRRLPFCKIPNFFEIYFVILCNLVAILVVILSIGWHLEKNKELYPSFSLKHQPSINPVENSVEPQQVVTTMCICNGLELLSTISEISLHWFQNEIKVYLYHMRCPLQTLFIYND